MYLKAIDIYMEIMNRGMVKLVMAITMDGGNNILMVGEYVC